MSRHRSPLIAKAILSRKKNGRGIITGDRKLYYKAIVKKHKPSMVQFLLNSFIKDIPIYLIVLSQGL